VSFKKKSSSDNLLLLEKFGVKEVNEAVWEFKEFGARRFQLQIHQRILETS